eukprot:GILK01013378.1.p1 GENE.GILK01013378.1~~GILK01013378.1.p1  ORF type:complete len:245 (-),score=37.81 GILK01013378.1:38-664(-)
MEAVLNRRSSAVRIVLENIADQQNASAVIRTAEGFGVHHLHFIQAYNPAPSFSHVSKGTDKWLRFHYSDETESCLQDLKFKNFVVLATDLSPGAVPIEEVDFAPYKAAIEKKEGGIALLFGNEVRGISPMARELADVKFVLPMTGFVQSYNLSVAAALTLSHLQHVGILPGNGLDKHEHEETLAKWLLGEHKSTRYILERAGIKLDDY